MLLVVPMAQVSKDCPTTLWAMRICIDGKIMTAVSGEWRYSIALKLIPALKADIAPSVSLFKAPLHLLANRDL